MLTDVISIAIFLLQLSAITGKLKNQQKRGLFGDLDYKNYKNREMPVDHRLMSKDFSIFAPGRKNQL